MQDCVRKLKYGGYFVIDCSRYSPLNMSQVKDRQMLANTVDTSQSRLKMGRGHSNRMLTVGELLYQMTGLLMLQRLYTDVLDEKRRLEARVPKQELLCGVKGQLLSRGESSDEVVTTLSNMDSKSQADGNNSLFSPVYRSMHLQLTKYEQMMVDTEGKTAKGLIKVLTVTHIVLEPCHDQSLSCHIAGKSRAETIMSTPTNSHRGIGTRTTIVPSNTTVSF